MEPTEPRLIDVDHDLEIHVATTQLKFQNMEQSITRIDQAQVRTEKAIEKLAADNKQEFSEIKKMFVWAATTVIGTLLVALVTAVFKVM